MNELRPGDVVLCSCCGAQALAVFTGGADRWREGQSSTLLWDHGPGPRYELAHVRPDLCIWCKERQAALPGSAPLFRPAGQRSVAELDVAFWAAWSGGPNPHAAPSAAGVGEGPFRVEPGDRGGSSSSVQKAPLERPAPVPAGEVQAPSVACALGGEVELSPDDVRTLVREAGTAVAERDRMHMRRAAPAPRAQLDLFGGTR